MSDNLVKRLRLANAYKGPDFSTPFVEPVKLEAADRIEELEAKLAKALPNDGRPCSTDVFLSVLLEEIDDHYYWYDAIKPWLEGKWDEAVKGTSLAEMKEGKE